MPYVENNLMEFMNVGFWGEEKLKPECPAENLSEQGENQP